MGDIETRNPFEIFKALESFQSVDESALRAFGESLVEAAQAVVTAMDIAGRLGLIFYIFNF